MKNFILTLSIFLLCSCVKNLSSEHSSTHNNKKTICYINAVVDGMLQFNTGAELNSTISKLREQNSFDLNIGEGTKSGNNFISLRQKLIEQGLREFSNEELSVIQQENLIYEPVDSLILDPYFCTVLNADREIMVGDNIFKYVEEGVVSYKFQDRPLVQETLLTDLEAINSSDLSTGQSVTLNKNAQFRKLDYNEVIRIDFDSEIKNNTDHISQKPLPSPGSTPITTVINDNESIVAYNGNNLILADGTIINGNKLRKISYKQGIGTNDANWFEKAWGNFFGQNIIAVKDFDSNHRMKLRMYSQDLYIYRSVGMTVSMQKNVFGIWWRIKADEFRYGWTAIECKYIYDQDLFPKPPTFNGTTAKSNIPEAMKKKNSPSKDEQVVLIKLDFIDYELTTGDLNKFLANGIKKCANKIRSWINSGNSNDEKTPKGLFAVDEKDRTIYVIYPQGEKSAYNTGRENIRWDYDWFHGTYIMGFSIGIGYNFFAFSELSLKTSSNIELGRGCIYAAVKYDGEWRACIINTE